MDIIVPDKSLYDKPLLTTVKRVFNDPYRYQWVRSHFITLGGNWVRSGWKGKLSRFVTDKILSYLCQLF